MSKQLSAFEADLFRTHVDEHFPQEVHLSGSICQTISLDVLLHPDKEIAVGAIATTLATFIPVPMNFRRLSF